MPAFYTQVELDIEEFVDGCDDDDIQDLIEYLKNRDYLDGDFMTISGSNTSLMERDFIEKCNCLAKSYIRVSNEDIEVIEKLYKKYC
jgi:hypothetical protein